MWKKSTRSAASNNDCVEVSVLETGVLVRDSKNKSGPMLQFHTQSWIAFIEAVRDSQFDHDLKRRQMRETAG
ncbi:DUF397 domain-containing protein [Virgisporangium aurantiacum]|uniref:DUF397 domain-containing protein n=1 Tax=Virgisporangium aurantiacum TaxID=175570 RepID=UPI0019507181|nr:DUF397 domain-containing protein [Virgisporangium aurantiacum]